MQRKNDLLKPRPRTLREGFAMLTAVMIMVVIASIMAFSIDTTAKTSKRIIDDYIKTQAELYAKNAVEYALYKLSENNGTCVTINDFSIDSLYAVHIDIRYAYSNPPAGCVSDLPLTAMDVNATEAGEQYGYVQISAYVSAGGNVDDLVAEPIRVVWRSNEPITDFLRRR